ncbi:Catechol 2,3-dioxygenase [Paenibacillus sp. ov031]|uniref:VOC family protein n=1 Tax=unclassified Paenibacillus TaxID=185978 RepID=UPI000897DC23|nr:MULTISPECIES: VOC family protein [unclassified Paenibacillus]SEA45996.1 Catechol 2,3-dioxygenase [Paenibacillus sp. 276b]SHN56474.1 Catechol 2,3-dioxygenase [Paenibacillus sp. ov031]
MKINHLNLTVTDVIEVQHFLETYFGLTCYVNAGKSFAAMTDDDGFLLNLMYGKDIKYPETFHVGFPQDSKEEVDNLNQRLKNDGIQVESPAIVHGSYTFYLQAPGGITLEAYCLIEGEDPTKGPRPSFGKL